MNFIFIMVEYIEMNSNGVGPAPTCVIRDGKKEWNVKCYCGANMIPVLLPYPEYLRECEIPDCKSCAHDRFAGKPGAFYSCSRDGCDCLHSADRLTINGDYYVGKPLGVTASDHCQKLRHYAHIEFDHMCMSKQKCYRILAKLMRLPISKAHMAQFDIAQCITAIRLIRKYKVENLIPLLIPSDIVWKNSK